MPGDPLRDEVDRLNAELDRHRAGYGEWRTLTERLVAVDPFAGFGGCLWCGVELGEEHGSACAWADARDALDLAA
jgi:hypothetical protein